MEPAPPADDPYKVSYELTKVFGPDEISEYTRAFKSYDNDKNGTLDKTELKTVMVDLGLRDVTEEQTNDLLASIDSNQDNKISFPEFLELFKRLKSGDGNNDVVEMMSKAGMTAVKGVGDSGFQHSISDEERFTFTSMINEILKGDADL